MTLKKNQDLGKALGHTKTDKRIDILRRLQEAGSISEAARRAGVSYKAAWQAIDTLSNLAGTPLVEKVVGGSGGGGAQLTIAGKDLLKASSELEIAKSKLLKKSKPLAVADTLAKGILVFQTTMRNQFPATVSGIVKKNGSVKVSLTTKGASVFHARITAASAELFELQIGQKVIVLFKATAVQIVRSRNDEFQNVIPGVIVRKSRGNQNGELSLLVEPGVTLVGFTDQLQKFNISEDAFAHIDETAVVLALTHD